MTTITTASAETPVDKDPHEPHWISRSAFQALVFALLFAEMGVFIAVYQGITWLTVVMVLVASHFMHGVLIGFHEASHGLLRKNRTFNEFDGVVIGVLSLTSFSLYRWAHQTHHMHLATVKDEELWPFVDPKTPRWFRRLAAFLELTCGLVYTPFIFLRTFLRPNSPIRNRRVRRRIWNEIMLIIAVWALIVSLVAWQGWWKYFFTLYLVPAVLAANMQSWRKYIEHIGLRGTSATGATRSIISEGLSGNLLALTLLHEPFHGIHHKHMSLPHSVLPFHSAELMPTNDEETMPYPNYRSAVIDLLKDLWDPKVGPLWYRQPPEGRPG
jgi:fatty acid desaturase